MAKKQGTQKSRFLQADCFCVSSGATENWKIPSAGLDALISSSRKEILMPSKFSSLSASIAFGLGLAFSAQAQDVEKQGKV